MGRSLVKVYKKSIMNIDKGWRRIVRELQAAESSFVKVGLPEDGTVAETSKSGSGREAFTEMSELVQVGAANEFGTSRIPERSFMRSTFDEQKERLKQIIERLYFRIVDGQETTAGALDKMGIWFTDRVRRKITTLRTPPNAASTIRRKKSSNPLIDTGQMRASIQHKVFMK